MFYGDQVMGVLVDILCYYGDGKSGDIFFDYYEGNKVYLSIVIVFVVSFDLDFIFYFMLEY